MSAKLVNFKLNTYGVRELLRSDEVRVMLEGVAYERCPDGYTVESRAGMNRMQTRATISASDSKSMQDNLENNTLLVAIS